MVAPHFVLEVVAETVGERDLAAPPPVQKDDLLRVDGGGAGALHSGVRRADSYRINLIPSI